MNSREPGISDCELARLLADHLARAAGEELEAPHIIVCTDATGVATHHGPFANAEAAQAQVQTCEDGQRATSDGPSDVRCVVAPLFPIGDLADLPD